MIQIRRLLPPLNEREPSYVRTILCSAIPLQRADEAAAAALAFAVDPGQITMEPGPSYLPSPIKLHDHAAASWPRSTRSSNISAVFGPAVSDHEPEPSGCAGSTSTGSPASA